MGRLWNARSYVHICGRKHGHRVVLLEIHPVFPHLGCKEVTDFENTVRKLLYQYECQRRTAAGYPIPGGGAEIHVTPGYLFCKGMVHMYCQSKQSLAGKCSVQGVVCSALVIKFHTAANDPRDVKYNYRRRTCNGPICVPTGSRSGRRLYTNTMCSLTTSITQSGFWMPGQSMRVRMHRHRLPSLEMAPHKSALL